MPRTAFPLYAGVVLALGACGSGASGLGGAGDAGTGGDARAQVNSARDAGRDAGASAAAGSDAGAATLPSPGCGQLTAAGDTTWNLQFGGLDRSFQVHVPPSYGAVPVPLVLDFHGFTSNGAEEQLLTNMNGKADAAGFIAVHPEGTGVPTGWNAGACCGSAASTGVDDVGFVNAMLDMLEARLCIDSRRVYAAGMSNGGFLSHRLGCELSGRIAAIAPVAGVMGISDCAPTRAMPVLHFHGTGDPIVPYGGNPAMGFASVADTFAGWAKRDGCTDAAPARTFMMADMHCDTYAACQDGAEVTLCTIDGGGHTWPGGLPIPTGITSPVSATDLMWGFFQRHPLPAD